MPTTRASTASPERAISSARLRAAAWVCRLRSSTRRSRADRCRAALLITSPLSVPAGPTPPRGRGMPGCYRNGISVAIEPEEPVHGEPAPGKHHDPSGHREKAEIPQDLEKIPRPHAGSRCGPAAAETSAVDGQAARPDRDDPRDE